MRKFLVLLVFIIGLSCNNKTEVKKESKLDEELSDLKSENDSLKLELKKYKTQSKENIKFFLTNNSVKYWRVNSINGRNIEDAITRIVWEFDNKNNYNTYGQKNDSLIPTEIGDKRYSNTFKIISRNEILLNGYQNIIKKVTIDTLEIKINNRLFILIPLK